MKQVIKLNRKLELQSHLNIPDGRGGYTDAWTRLGDLWALVQVRTGYRRETNLNHLSEVRFQIIVRAAPKGSSMRPFAGQRFLDGERIFKIDAVSEYDPNVLYLEIWATEEVKS